MLTPCTTSTRPKPGQPDYFTFDPVVLPIPYAALANWLVSTALGLPSGVVRTSDFCAAMPQGDLPRTEDWLALFAPYSPDQGVFVRLGNFVRQQYFSDR